MSACLPATTAAVQTLVFHSILINLPRTQIDTQELECRQLFRPAEGTSADSDGPVANEVGHGNAATRQQGGHVANSFCTAAAAVR